MRNCRGAPARYSRWCLEHTRANNHHQAQAELRHELGDPGPRREPSAPGESLNNYQCDSDDHAAPAGTTTTTTSTRTAVLVT
eukprot:1057958-Rhodomonas_salina.3